RTRLEDSVAGIIFKLIIKNHLGVGKPDKDESIINVRFISKDELLSKYFNESLVENVSQFYLQTQMKRSMENVHILQYQVDSVKRVLDMALTGVGVTTDQNPNLNPAYQRLKVNTQKKLVDVEMNKAILEELVKNLELSKIS